MAKLNKRQQRNLVADLLMIANGTSPDERQKWIDKVINDLAIEHDEYAEGLEVFEYLHGKAKRQGRPVEPPTITAADICTIDADGQLQTDREKFDKASSAVRDQVLRYMSAYNWALATGAPLPMPPGYKPPAQPPETTPADKLPTKRMRDSVTRFDQMTDGDQVDSLRDLWGEDGQP